MDYAKTTLTVNRADRDYDDLASQMNDDVEFQILVPGGRPDEFDGWVADESDIYGLAAKALRIEAQGRARDLAAKFIKNGGDPADTEALESFVQDGLDRWVYRGSGTQETNILVARDLVDNPEDPAESELAMLEKLDNQPENMVIWDGVSR